MGIIPVDENLTNILEVIRMNLNKQNGKDISWAYIALMKGTDAAIE